MCARYMVVSEEELEFIIRYTAALPAGFGAGFYGTDRFPGCETPALCADFSWKLPVWGISGIKTGLIYNTRSETMEESRLFSPLLRSGRCLLPAAAYYEWDRSEGKPKRYTFRRPDGAPFLLCGLMTQAPDKGQARCTVITRDAAPGLAHIHDRMPLVLTPEHAASWLTREYSSSLLECAEENFVIRAS